MFYTKKNTQTLKILRHLKTYGNITSLDAFEHYRATRLSAIIFRLREEGFDIDTKRIQHKEANFGKYVLEDTQNNNQLLYDLRRLI
tara:strand:- start:316 stop:573 length:258 start_codon:yes stop_codon:yes gene_type:complete